MNWIYVLLISCVVCQKIRDSDAFIATPQSYTILQNMRYAHYTRGTKPQNIRYVHHTLQLTNNNDEEYDADGRDNFGRSLRGLQSSALKTQIDVGDTVVCKLSIPNAGIYADASYEVKSIYTQSFDVETQQVMKEQLNSLDDNDSSSSEQSKVYMTLYNPQYHTGGSPVVVTPEEVGLITIREEIGNAAWLAVPGFFWIFVCASFFNTYHERTGGSFADALMGR